MGESVEAWAPGRVNLLGEHTDYSGGLVLPLAIDQGTHVRADRRDDGLIQISSSVAEAPVRLSASSCPVAGAQRWANYVLGTIAELWQYADFSGGLELRIRGDLPLGAGLSSSASLGVACAKALDSLYDCGRSDLQLAQACQQAEHRFAGVECGIMDHAAAALAQPGQALLLDCQTLAHQIVLLPEVVVVVIHSGISHALAVSGYNERVGECRAVLQRMPGCAALGELTPADLPEVRRRVDGTLRRRAEHVILENARVRTALPLLEAQDLAGFGRLMFESHASLRDNYEVSCAELDAIVEAVRSEVYGAKMTGAGFGGAVVALVARDRLDCLRARVGQWPFTVVSGASR